MDSTNKTDPEAVKSEVPAPPPSSGGNLAVDALLRVLLFAVSLTALIVMVTAKQTEAVVVPGITILVPVKAKFSYSPANVYFVAALSVACLYSIISTLASLSANSRPAHAAKFLVYLTFWDVLILGIVASATGTAGGVAYVGLRGNSHAKWNKICNVYDTYCRHIGSAVGLSLAASIILVLLIFLSLLSLHRRIPTTSSY